MLQEIINTANMGFVVVGPQLDIRLWNRWMVQVTGIESEVACCKTLIEALPSVKHSSLIEKVESALEKGMSVRLPPGSANQISELGAVNILVQPLKARRHLHTLRPLNEEKADPLCLIQFSVQSEKPLVAPVATDVAHDGLADSTTDARFEFLATIGHQIRTPVNGVLGVADLLAGTKLNHEQRKYVDLLVRSGQSLLDFINEMTDLSLLEAGQVTLQPETFNLPRLMQDVMNLFASSGSVKGVRGVVDLPKGLPTFIRTDAHKLRQILVNLLSNAFKFTDKGRVSLNVSYEGEAQRGTLTFEIADTGVGIPPARINGLFEKLRMDATGISRLFNKTGLGLYICHELVELFGGEIRVESAVGQGTVFTVSLPVEVADERTGLMAESGKAKALSGDGYGPWRVLVAEDNPVNQTLICKLLEKQGHSVVLAANGQEAVTAVQIQEAFDIILMDISMPVMDGLEATALIRSLVGRNGQVPIIALTAHAMGGDRELFLEAGMDGYHSKPVNPPKLFEAMARTIEEHRRNKARMFAKEQGQPARPENEPANWPRSRESDPRHENDPYDP
ncbi:ATP-binding protein [Kordiimonas sp.]|uniref:ATP-binding protein n=1 Tax=Kordiimonas sp. TaxID=1970157 RepID=UPI003A8E99F6